MAAEFHSPSVRSGALGNWPASGCHYLTLREMRFLRRTRTRTLVAFLGRYGTLAGSREADDGADKNDRNCSKPHA